MRSRPGQLVTWIADFTLGQQPSLKELSDLLAPPVTSPFMAENEAVSA